MTRDPIGEMERAASRLLPKPPGIIIPGMFGAEWALVLGGIVVLVLIGYGISLLL